MLRRIDPSWNMFYISSHSKIIILILNDYYKKIFVLEKLDFINWNLYKTSDPLLENEKTSLFT